MALQQHCNNLHNIAKLSVATAVSCYSRTSNDRCARKQQLQAANRIRYVYLCHELWSLCLLGMPRGVNKADLPSKTCVVCLRPFTWRKVYEKCWDQVSARVCAGVVSAASQAVAAWLVLLKSAAAVATMHEVLLPALLHTMQMLPPS